MSVWDQLLGQDAVVAQLRRAAQEDRPTHAWLFTGPPGSGRSNAALAFAAALLCEQEDPVERGCGQCHACRTVLASSHADLTGPRWAAGASWWSRTPTAWRSAPRT